MNFNSSIINKVGTRNIKMNMSAMEAYILVGAKEITNQVNIN